MDLLEILSTIIPPELIPPSSKECANYAKSTVAPTIEKLTDMSHLQDIAICEDRSQNKSLMIVFTLVIIPH